MQLVEHEPIAFLQSSIFFSAQGRFRLDKAALAFFQRELLLLCVALRFGWLVLRGEHAVQGVGVTVRDENIRHATTEVRDRSGEGVGVDHDRWEHVSQTNQGVFDLLESTPVADRGEESVEFHLRDAARIYNRNKNS